MDVSALNTFSKTLLALAISACASPSFALDYDIGQGRVQLNKQQINDGVTIIGSASLKDSIQNETEIRLKNTSITGSLINNASITVDAADHNISGLGINEWSSFYDAPSRFDTIGGDIRNNGSIKLNNVDSAEGIDIGPVVVKGSVINAGAVVIRQGSKPDFLGGSEGLYLHGTQIAGDLLNSGVIDVTAEGGRGLIIDRDGKVEFELGGKLINSGTILVTGTDVRGLDIETATTPLVIQNSGLIKVAGDDSVAAVLWEGTIDAFNNSGSIIAQGSDAHAIVFKGATLTNTLPSGERGVVNTGTISADGDAIVVTPQAPAEGFEINQRAGKIVSTNGAAIQGGGLATLNWSGGDIQGDLLEMAGVNVTGPAGFRGSHIDSNVSIANGGALNLASAGTAISGDLDVAGLSAIDMRLSNATLNTAPYLTVGGVARFANGSRITLSANPGDFTPTAEGKTYSLL
jgi:hypothetical protein